MGPDLIVALAGMIIPSAVDFIKKKFLKKEENSPEATLSTLATTKPEVMPEYIKAQTGYMDATIRYFNRDVAGTPSQIIVDLRAAIRPVGVIISMITLIVLAVMALFGVTVNPSLQDTLTGIRLSCELVVSSWFGDRISLGK